MNTVVSERQNIEAVTDTILGSERVTAFSLTGSTETGKASLELTRSLL